MKQIFTRSLLLLFVTLMLGSGAYAQEETKTYTWDAYKTKWKVPTDFRILESSGTKWSGTNDKITMSIYPRKDENLSEEGMKDAIISWARGNEVEDRGEVIDLDDEKLNGYWGVLIEGTKSGFPVGQLLLVDPDYPEISLYVWISYDEAYVDAAIEILMSFTPM